MSAPDQGVVRPLVASDRDRVESIVRAVGNFSAAEIDTALELVDEWLDLGEESGYFVFVLEADRDVRGYVCVGPTPLTESTYDLYWIAVDANAQGAGFGQRLLTFAENEVRRRGGNLLLIETGSHDSYLATVRFYERAGYELLSRIRNYYRPGDDKLTFGKALG
ncbi:MAG: GNAT family N-acetyltransferase [Gemmatimonadaceae bacterium]